MIQWTKTSGLAAFAGIVIGLAAVPAPGTADEAHRKPAKTRPADQLEKTKQNMRTELAGAPEIGKPAPDFTLTDTEGKTHSLSAYLEAGNTVVLEWFNPDCPFVKKHHKNNKTMAATYAEFADEKIVWLAINSGAPGKQGHGIERNRKAREEYGMKYPVLFDEAGEVGRLYGAKTTPHMFVISSDGTLLYRGAIDDVANAKTVGEKNFVKNALTECLHGGEVSVSQTKPYGCSVKYGT